MVLIKEFRIVMPMSSEEYNRGSRYSLAKETKLQSSAEEGVETLVNEPFDDPSAPDPRYRKGVYTHKVLHLGARVPSLVRRITPKKALMLDEKSWNCAPYCKTVYSSSYFGEKFSLTVETVIKDNDRGQTENALDLPAHVLSKRLVDMVDIVGDPGIESDAEHPGKVRSEKAGRGPLQPDFARTHEPVMCVYKLVVGVFRQKPISKKAEEMMLQMGMRDLLLPFHRHIYLWMDEWFHLTNEEIAQHEASIYAELNQLDFKTGTKGGAPLDEKAPEVLTEVPEEERLSTPQSKKLL